MASHGTTKSRTKQRRVDTQDKLWSHHHAQWRDSAQIAAQWHAAHDVDPSTLKFRTTGGWWDIIEELGVTLLVSREYEHLLLSLTVQDGSPRISYMAMPHPSGVAVDRKSSTVFVASTRNPNQIYDLVPVDGAMERRDVDVEDWEHRPLVPLRSRFMPGCLYMHDLAVIDGKLYANAVGQNAVIEVQSDGAYEQVWWPKAIESKGGPQFGVNYIQLNSIAAGKTIDRSFFSASSERISSRRPGHRNYPVDGRGVIFSGETREPIARGLTRPHSARLHKGQLFVDNSGYGELVVIRDGVPEVVSSLPGWTRGLCFAGDIAFVGTSRVIPRFAQYAPGLKVESSKSGVHAVDLKSGRILGSLYWPNGNQIFAIDWLPAKITSGFPFQISRRPREEKLLFYTFRS